jgi:hypothetical protein
MPLSQPLSGQSCGLIWAGGGFFRNHTLEPSFAVHTAALLELTLLRHGHTRARTEIESPLPPISDTIIEELTSVLNGDWRSPRLQHFCRGQCCRGGDVDVCVERVLAVLTPLLLDRLGERVPSANRWHTFGPALETQGFGLVCHNILVRLSEVIAKLPNATPDLAAAEDMSFQAYRAAKDRRAGSFLQDPLSSRVVGLACATTEPIDKLSARLQHLDHTSHSVTEISDLVKECQSSLYALVHPHLADSLASRSLRMMCR